MRITSWSKALVGAGLLTVSLSARLLAEEPKLLIEGKEFSKGGLGCPTPGVDAREYREQFRAINTNYVAIKSALDKFIDAFEDNSNPSCYNSPTPPTLSDPVNYYYVQLGNLLRSVAECENPNYPNWDDRDCEFRAVIALPDGTVVFDTHKGDPVCPIPTNIFYSDIGQYGNSASAFKAKIVSDNHNTRISIQQAQVNECGNQWETRASEFDGERSHYVAQRLGARFDNSGTVQFSKHGREHDHMQSKTSK